MPRTLPSRLLILSALALAAALPAAAQYRTPGSRIEINSGRQQQLEDAVEDARWDLGGLRVQPWIGINNLAYQDPIETPDGPTSDIHLTAGAGLKFYLPVGSDTFVVAHALPQYSYWLDLEDRNEQIGRYGIGVFGFLNRLEFEVTGRQIEEVAFLSNEVLRDVPQTQQILETRFQLRVAGSLAIAVSGTQDSRDADDFSRTSGEVLPIETQGGSLILPSDPGFLIDREETILRAGVRYLLRHNGGYIGVGLQDEENRFDFANGRDNDGTSTYVEALLQGNKIDIAFDFAQRDLQATMDGSFPGFEETTGRILVALHPRSTSEIQFYASRSLEYSTLDSNSYYQADNYGIAGDLTLSHRSHLSAYYETGENGYFASVMNPLLPDEDTTAWGASLSYELGRSLSLRLGYRLAEYDSRDDLRDRQVEQIVLGLSLGGQFSDW